MTNITSNLTGKKQSPQHIKNSIRARMKNAEKLGYYKPGSERSQKISKSLKGRIISEEWKEKMRASWVYEKHVTPESISKQRLARLGQIFPTKDSIELEDYRILYEPPIPEDPEVVKKRKEDAFKLKALEITSKLNNTKKIEITEDF